MENLMSLALIWASVILSSWFAKKTKLTPLVYYLVAGSLLLNFNLLPAEPTPFIQGFSEFGIILIMFALGFEENPTTFLRSAKRSWGIALFGAIAPFFAAYFIALYFWGEHNIALLVGLTMTATAVSLTMMVLKHEKLHLTKAATGIMTSAVLDDVASLVLVAVLVPIVAGQEVPTLIGIGTILLKAIGFFVFIFLCAISVFPTKEISQNEDKLSFFQKYGLNNLLTFNDGKDATLSILMIAVVFGVIAHMMGLHAAVGAYMAGLIMTPALFYFEKKGEPVNRYKKTRKIIDDVAFSWIGPVFFVNLGAKLVFDLDLIVSVLDETLILFISVFLAQMISAALAARYTGNYSFEESIMIGLGMLGRAELAFVVMDIGYVHNSIFTDQVFYTLMFTAFALNISVPLLIRYWTPYFKASRKIE
jgi:Na+:H+ antiporter